MAESHIRIDEGIKRGPRKKPQPPAERPAQVNYRLPNKALAKVDPSTVIHRLLADETLAEIATSLQVSRSGLNQWLLTNCESEWQSVQVARSLTALEEAKDGVKNAPDALSLARARETLRSAQWDLERLFSRLFGQKQEVKIDVDMRVQVTQALTARASELLQSIRGAVPLPQSTIEGEVKEVK